MIDDGTWQQKQILISLILLSTAIPLATKGTRICHGKRLCPKTRNNQSISVFYKSNHASSKSIFTKILGASEMPLRQLPHNIPDFKGVNAYPLESSLSEGN